MKPYAEQTDLYCAGKGVYGSFLRVATSRNMWSIGVTSVSLPGTYLHYDHTGVLAQQSIQGEWVYVMKGSIWLSNQRFPNGLQNCRQGELAFLPPCTPLHYAVDEPTVTLSLWEEAYGVTMAHMALCSLMDDVQWAIADTAPTIGRGVNIRKALIFLDYAYRTG